MTGPHPGRVASGPVRLRSALPAVVLALLTFAGCAGSPSLPTAPSLESKIAVDTPALRAQKAEAGVEACPEAVKGASSGTSESTSEGADLPDLTLACLGGGSAVTLSDLEGPAVLSVWASWCGPCEKEMPYFARLHRVAGDDLTLLGVNYEDPSPDAALDLLTRKKATFPQVADPGGGLADHYRVRGLPGILFVDAEGTVSWRNIAVDSYAELAGLVGDLAGVDVTAR